jgi:hypothetical protein
MTPARVPGVAWHRLISAPHERPQRDAGNGIRLTGSENAGRRRPRLMATTGRHCPGRSAPNRPGLDKYWLAGQPTEYHG